MPHRAEDRLLPADPPSIVVGPRPREAAREGDTWRRVTTVEIPETGLAARTYGVEDVTVPGDRRAVRTVLMQTFIALPGRAEQVAPVAGSTSVLDLAESFFDVFDAVTATFGYREPGAVTTTSPPVS